MRKSTFVLTLQVSLLLAALVSAGLIVFRPIGRHSTPPPDPAAALFEETAARAGVRFHHSSGFREKFYFIETMPPGCALFDFDNDGWLDILCIQSGPSDPPDGRTPRPVCRLFHNNRNGTFTDVTAGSRLDQDLGYGYGVTVGDFDNDGLDDLFITSFGGCRLFHNEGRGRFRDVTKSMGLEALEGAFATSAAFGDYDNDGRLDLYVCCYSPWHWRSNRVCTNVENLPEYCSPESLPAATHRLFHNDGDHFTDVTHRAGIDRMEGRGLAVAFVESECRGKQDIFVANDMCASMLWRNKGDGTFTNVAEQAGCAYNGRGETLSGMGIALGDYNHSGAEAVFVADYSTKVKPLYNRESPGKWRDSSSSPQSGLMPTRNFLSWGCEFIDYDADGWLDLVINNGHVNYRSETGVIREPYRQRKQLFHNVSGRFVEVTGPGQLGPLGSPMLGRGLATGDYDNDGRIDVLAMNQNQEAQLFHNRNRNGNHWISIKTIGRKSNRDGFHTKIRIKSAVGVQTVTVHAGSSFLSASDRRVYFGLGRAFRIDSIELRWPSGVRETIRNVQPDRFYIATEGSGLREWKP